MKKCSKDEFESFITSNINNVKVAPDVAGGTIVYDRNKSIPDAPVIVARASATKPMTYEIDDTHIF